MRNWIAKLQANPWLWHKLFLVALLASVGAGGFWWGRHQVSTKADEKASLFGDDNKQKEITSGRVVAYIFGDMPITREEYAEYLITRSSPERLEFMVNRKIVEIECQKHNIHVTDGEVDGRLDHDLWAYGGKTKLTLKEFETSVLRRFGKTIVEWKEDVIRPKIMMEKLVRATVKIQPKDVEDGFEAKYGPKVKCRMIVIPGGDAAAAQKVWEMARKGRADFLEQARKQPIPQLASKEGEVPPIHKHVGDKKLEETAFSMKPNEISGLLEMQDKSYVILLCEEHLPRDVSVKFADVRMKLDQEIREYRVTQKVPEVFKQLHTAATPRLYLKEMMQTSGNIMTASYTREANKKEGVSQPPVPRPIVPPKDVNVGPRPSEEPLPPLPKVTGKN